MDLLGFLRRGWSRGTSESPPPTVDAFPLVVSTPSDNLLRDSPRGTPERYGSPQGTSGASKEVSILGKFGRRGSELSRPTTATPDSTVVSFSGIGLSLIASVHGQSVGTPTPDDGDATDTLESPRASRKAKYKANKDNEGFEGAYTDEFWQAVVDKEQLEGFTKKQAICEARLDRIYAMNDGSAEKGLLYILINAQSQGEACSLVEGIISRGVDLGSRDDYPGSGPLHIAAQRDFTYVAMVLLDNEVPTDTLSEDGKLAAQIALEGQNDELAGLIMKKMSKASVRKLFEAPNDDTEPCFNYQDLLLSGCMQNACRAVLDACLEPTDEPGEFRFHYRILEADQFGQTPNSINFNPNTKTAFHRILETEDKELLHHYVSRMIIHNKWSEYGERRAWINLALYIAFLVTFTVALILAVRKHDPREYTDTDDYIRAVMETIYIIGTIINLVDEIKEMIRERMDYLRQPYNYLQILSIFLVLLIIPLRWVNSNWQWNIACLAYVLLAMRVLKLISVTRVVGIYLQILTRILIADLSSFIIIFMIFLLTYVGALMLALRGEMLDNPPEVNMTIIKDPTQTTKLAVSKLTNTYYHILVTGLRTMIQQENIVDYIAEDGESFGWLGVIINMVFLFVVLVVLLNILIAQLSDTYAEVKADALRELEMNWGLALKNLEQGPLKHKRLKNYDPYEDVANPAKNLLGWEAPKADGNKEEDGRKQRQMEQQLNKQHQQIMALKSQMRTSLEMLRKNEKVPPRLHGAVESLGTETIPNTMTSIVNDSQSIIVEELTTSGQKNEKQFKSLSEHVQDSTTQVRKTVLEAQAHVIKHLEEKLDLTKQELVSVKEALAAVIPQAVGGIVGEAHSSSVSNLADKINRNHIVVSTIQAVVQEQLPLALQSMVKETQEEILRAVNEVCQQVPKMVETTVRRSEEELRKTLSRQLDGAVSHLQTDIAREMATQLERRQKEMLSVLEAQLTELAANLKQPTPSVSSVDA